MRRWFKRILPNHEVIRDNRWLRPFRNTLLHPRLWHINRRSVSAGVAVGLWCGLIPGPFQMLTAALLCVLFRANLPVAVFTTLYTNPLTIPVIYFAAFQIGSFLLGREDGGFQPAPEWGEQSLGEWMDQAFAWVASLGTPLFFGLFVLASTLAIAGYFLVRAWWRWHLIQQWRRRRSRRRATAACFTRGKEGG
ncbi:MAG: DUF2062 domain-containing protein [Rhodocyclales bacterium]|nr:DUF2062 domain-containing protein [Rhodocyclales bacterium]